MKLTVVAASMLFFVIVAGAGERLTVHEVVNAESVDQLRLDFEQRRSFFDDVEEKARTGYFTDYEPTLKVLDVMSWLGEAQRDDGVDKDATALEIVKCLIRNAMPPESIGQLLRDAAPFPFRFLGPRYTKDRYFSMLIEGSPPANLDEFRLVARAAANDPEATDPAGSWWVGEAIRKDFTLFSRLIDRLSFSELSQFRGYAVGLDIDLKLMLLALSRAQSPEEVLEALDLSRIDRSRLRPVDEGGKADLTLVEYRKQRREALDNFLPFFQQLKPDKAQLAEFKKRRELRLEHIKECERMLKAKR